MTLVHAPSLHLYPFCFYLPGLNADGSIPAPGTDSPVLPIPAGWILGISYSEIENYSPRAGIKSSSPEHILSTTNWAIPCRRPVLLYRVAPRVRTLHKWLTPCLARRLPKTFPRITAPFTRGCPHFRVDPRQTIKTLQLETLALGPNLKSSNVEFRVP